MSTSGTVTYNISAQDIIDLSLTDIGANGPAYQDPSLRPHALKALNLVMKAIDTKGVWIWRAPRRTVNLTAGTASYVLSNDTWDVDAPARYVQSGATYGSQVMPIARDEYMRLPDRTIQGISMQYFADRGFDANGLQQITLYLYPVPPNTGDTLEIASTLKSQDVTNVAQTLDVNQKGLDAIRWNLTLNLAPSYGVPIDRMQFFKALADEKLAEFVNDSNERGDVQIVPFGSLYGYGYGSWGTGYR
jgi:hypothetical protein